VSNPADKPLVPLRDVFFQVWKLMLKEDRRHACGIVLLILVGTILETIGVGLIIPVVAVLGQPDSAAWPPFLHRFYGALGEPPLRGFTLWVLGGLLAAYLIKNAYLFFCTWCQARFLFAYQAKLASQLMRLYLKSPYIYHTQHPSAELIQKIQNELSSYTLNILSSFIWICSESFVVCGLLMVALWVNPAGAAVVFLGLIIALWGYANFFKARIEYWGRSTQENSQAIYENIQQSLGGIKEVKIFGREEFFSSVFNRNMQEMVRYASRHYFLSQSSRNIIELLIVGVLLGSVALLVSAGGENKTIMPTLAFFAVAAFRLMPSAQRLLNSVNSIRYGMRSLEVLRADIIAVHALEKVCLEPTEPLPFLSELQIENVQFRYPEREQDVLRRVNLIISRGEMVGLQGESGVGKTTLIDIILGLLEPTNGDVLIDGKSIHKNVEGWRSKIGYVPQSIRLIDDTVRRNVAFGLPDDEIDDSRVTRALRQSQLGDFVRDHPQGVETRVGEQGKLLSGGQQQRIGIARALYHDPDLLILDEATASLDLGVEAEIVETLKSLKGHKTMIIISHRTSTLKDCDTQYKLREGQLWR